jgi:hypothetical protein
VFVTFVSTRCQDLGDLGGRRTANRLVIDQARLFVGHKAHNVISAGACDICATSISDSCEHPQAFAFDTETKLSCQIPIGDISLWRDTLSVVVKRLYPVPINMYFPNL